MRSLTKPHARAGVGCGVWGVGEERPAPTPLGHQAPSSTGRLFWAGSPSLAQDRPYTPHPTPYKKARSASPIQRLQREREHHKSATVTPPI